MRTLLQDLRYGVRLLRKQPAFAATAILTLALGIGANTAMFSIVDAALLHPLPYREPRELLILRDVQPQAGEVPASYPEYLDWRQGLAAVAEVGASFNTLATLAGEGDPEALWTQRVSANLLPLLGVAPVVGRSFIPEEERQEAEPVVLLGEGLWRRRFGGDPGVVGRRLILDGEPHTVVGVLPASFRGVLPRDSSRARPRELWVPLRLDTEDAPRGLHFLTVIGRLRPGVSADEARERLAALAASLKQSGTSEHDAALRDLATFVSGDARPVLLALAAAVGAVLLVACANLASLLLARSAARRQEVAVRLAIGAGRGRLARQFLTESAALSLAGGAAGVGLAWLVLRWFESAESGWEGAPADLSLAPVVLAVAAGLSLVAGLLFGAAPALQASRSSAQQALGEAGRGTVSSRGWLRQALVISEVAVAIVLLVAAGLLVRSFALLVSVDKGFEARGVLTFGLSLPRESYADRARQTRFFSEVLAAVRAIPGVTAAGLVNELPLAGGGVNGGVGIPGASFPPDEAPVAEKRIVSPEYFAALRIPVLQGRAFRETDREGAPPVAIVSESFARRYQGAGSPLGRQIDFAWETTQPQQIVGVVADVKHYGLDDEPTPTVYVPYLQRPDFGFEIVVASRLDPESLSRAVRERVREVDPAQPLSRLQLFEDVLARALAPRRLALAVVGAFAGLTLVLAIVGIYGVVSYSTRQRTREIGVRVALGARPADVLRLVLRQGLGLTLAGAVAGALGALAIGRVLAAHLYTVSPRDPIAFAAAVVALAAVALAACYLPARRAARLDPVTALRE